MSAGRYSRRFIRLLYTHYWRRGRAGYEEILLPTACARAGADSGANTPILTTSFSRPAAPTRHRSHPRAPSSAGPAGCKMAGLGNGMMGCTRRHAPSDSGTGCAISGTLR